MSEVKKIVELKEEELDKVNGGSVGMELDLTKHYDITKVYCCNYCGAEGKKKSCYNCQYISYTKKYCNANKKPNLSNEQEN